MKISKPRMWWEAFALASVATLELSKPRMWWEAQGMPRRVRCLLSKPRMWWEASQRFSLKVNLWVVNYQTMIEPINQ